ncbi:MAG: glycosyltransferase family 4 protein [Nitrospirota bacterium]
MHVLIVTQYFWPENFRINDVAIGLKENGHEVTVLTGQPNYPEGRFFPGYGCWSKTEESYHGIRVLRVPLIPRGDGGALRLLLNFCSFALSASVFGAWRCRASYDVTLVFEPSPVTVGIPAIVLKKLRGAPILFWVQDLWPESLSATGATKSRWILGIVEFLVRRIYCQCDRILVQSEAFRTPIERLGVKREHIMYFPNSAEPFYQPLSLEREAPEHSQLPSGFRVVFGGNIGKAQSFGTILDAAELLKDQPEIHWIVLGDGRMFTWVQDQVERRGLGRTVHLLGRFPAESMPRYFALADVLLVTLLEQPIFALTIPSKVQSYLACGKPIVAALSGEGARIIREAEAGLTPPPEDPRALANSVLAMYNMPAEVRRAMGLRGRIYFETHFERMLLLERLDLWMNEVKGERMACGS